MNLEQMQISYLINEDRILLKMGFLTTDDVPAKQEIQIYITRRLLQNLWPVMIKAMATQITIDRPEAAFASDDIVQMEYQQAVAAIAESGNFNKPYTSEERESPLGEAPLLLETIQFSLNKHQPMSMQFLPFNGGNIDMHLPALILHGFCKLLQDAAKEAAWGLDLMMPGIEQSATPSRLLN
jgi:hypothetical protein